MRENAFRLCALVAGLSAAAQGATSPPETGWTRADANGALSAENPAAVERIQFGNQFQNSGLDQWCDSMPFTLPISQDLVEQLGPASVLTGGAFNGTRQFFRYPNGDVAINDQLEVRLDLGYERTILSAASGALGMYFGAVIDGQSLVTRPVHGADSCKELKRFYNPLDFKTVLPLDAARLGRMDVGELWMIPMTFSISLEPLDAGAVAPSKGLTKFAPSAAYLSLGASKTADPTITVYRAGPKEMRLKLHLDQVKAVNAQLGATFGPIPATDIGTPGLETLLSNIMPSTLPSTLLLFSRQIDSVLGIQAGLSEKRTSGRQVLLQYTLDPTDPKEMALLAKVIRGDLSVLRAMTDFATLRRQDASDPAILKQLDDLHRAHDRALNLAADMAGIDDYKSRTRALNFSVPVALGYTHSTTKTQDHYVTQSQNPGDVHSFKVLKQSELGFLSLPMVGSFINSSHAQGTQALVDDSAAAGASQGKPYLIYTQEWGLLRARRSSIGKALARADALMGSVGGQSDPNEITRLPEALRASAQNAHYHKGYLDLSLVLGPAALGKVLSASSDAVLHAFAGTLTGEQSALFNYLLRTSRRTDGGGLVVGRDQLNAIAGYPDAASDAQTRIWMMAEALCRKATRVVRSLSAARALAPLPQTQALFKLAAGQDGISRDDFLKLALALVSPDDVAGDVLLHLDADKTSASNFTARYVLNAPLFGDAALKSMSGVQRSFVTPTQAAPTND